jgi:hypothetical protein
MQHSRSDFVRVWNPRNQINEAGIVQIMPDRDLLE